MAMDLPIPKHFRCPISLDLMKDPVALSTGITYDRASIETWLDGGRTRTCPVTNQALQATPELTPNHAVRRMIQDWCVAHRSLGVARIPTPRDPATPARVKEMLACLELASARRDRARFLELAAETRRLARESERNRLCISSNGAARALAASLRDFSGDEGACSEAVSALACVLPLGGDARRHVESPEALRSVVSVLRSGDLEGRLNAVLLVRELAGAADGGRAAALAGTEGLVEAVVRLVKEPISPRTTKAALAAAYCLASASGEARSRLAGSGLVSVLLEEVLVGSDKGVCEKALGVLDAVLGEEGAREEACGHALAVPVLVKKMFRASETGTGFAVSGLWRLCGGCGEERRAGLARAALGAGAFQKLLLLLQVGCGEGTKAKASELLRMLNGWRGTDGECIDSADFRGIKRTF